MSGRVRVWAKALGAWAVMAVAMAWVSLAVAFEFGLGAALGTPWSRLLEDYDLRHGRLLRSFG